MLLFMAMATSAAAQRQSLGIFGTWGAVRDPGRCYAIAEPHQTPRAGDGRGFASVGYWPGRATAGQAYFRLTRAKREGSAILLRIDWENRQLMNGYAV